MKKLLTIIVLMLSISAQAQESSKHLKFMGIPMDCNAETFAKRLVREKKLIRKTPPIETETPILMGEFSNHKDCTFFVHGKENDLVSGVTVTIVHEEKFSILYTEYQTMKRRLETKYGKPTIVDEYFLNGEPSTDYGRMRELTEGNAKFEVTYVLEEGIVKMSMSSIDDIGRISILYVDKENALIENNKALDDL